MSKKDQVSILEMQTASRHLVSMVRTLLRYTNPFNVAEDHSQQWQAVDHQCDIVESALAKASEKRS